MTVMCRKTMSDLKCKRCGIERGYADANIADLKETCEVERKTSTPHGYSNTTTVPAQHDWEEQ